MRGFLLAFAVMVGVQPHMGEAQMVSLPAAATIARSERTITYGWLRHAMGFTFCLEGRGYSFVVPEQAEIDRLDTEAHESTHRDQYARFSSCEAFDEYARTPKGRLFIEAEAYAAGLCVSVKLGVNRDSLERNYADRISYWVMRQSVSPQVVIGILRQYTQKACPR